MRGVMYVVYGEDYVLPCLVSLWSLRKYWAGPVTIWTDQQLPSDDKSTVRKLEPHLGVGHPGYCAKSRVINESPYDATLYLDCDTLVCGDPTSLFVSEGDPTIRLVQHADWTVRSSVSWSHVEYVASCGFVHPDRKRRLWDANLPAINSGVFACSKACRLGEDWVAATAAMGNRHGDEMAMQFLMLDYPHSVVGEEYNCLPMWTKRQDAVIWHGITGTWGRAAAKWCDALTEAYDADFYKLKTMFPYGLGLRRR